MTQFPDKLYQNKGAKKFKAENGFDSDEEAAMCFGWLPNLSKC